jgi:exopolysaccharide biosynthesis polyprenyl glycosylphosphotransferase
MSVTSIGTSSDPPASIAPALGTARATGHDAGHDTGHADLHVVPDKRRWVTSRRRSSVAPVVVGLVCAVVVAFLADLALSAWACAAAWGVVAGTQAAVRRGHSVAVRTRIHQDLKAALALVSLVALAGVSGLVPLADARWGVAVLAAAGVISVATRSLQPQRPATRRVVLVGSQRDVEAYTGSVSGPDVMVVGTFVVDAGPAAVVHPSVAVPTTTGLETLDGLVSSVTGDVVLVLGGPETDAGFIRRVTWALERNPATVAVATPVSSVSAHRLATAELGGRTVLELGPLGASALQSRVKSVIDRVGAAALLVLVSPLLLLLVAAVRIDSKGPGLFVQTRVGRDGKPFRMVKLRTMYADAEAMKQALIEDNESDGGVLFKIRRDPRVTRVGYRLRRASLDELPQLLNVVVGHMSLIGPRPALPSEVASYDDDARRRLAVKPGITGLWQVSGRSDLMWDESLRLDLYYADNWRLCDDLTIAARTVGAVTLARGAY